MPRPRGGQLALALGPYSNRNLFSDHFLERILPEWPEFQAAASTDLFAQLNEIWQAERTTLPSANEAQTEERFIKPVLSRLGFAYTVQAGLPTATGHRQPDYALFADEEARRGGAEQTGSERYRHAVAVCDAKRFDRPLDRRRADGATNEDPVAQIIHYISVTRCGWGILTNGRLWRLYAAEGDLIEGACLEFDLCALLDAGDEAAFRFFATLLSAAAFAPDVEGRSLLDRALDGSRAQAVAVGDALQRQVFAALPLLAEGLLDDEERTDASLRAAFDNALVLLYRLLFCLHAEDRGLLPVENPHYLQYSLRRQREQLARDRESGRRFSTRSDDLFNDLRALFRIVDRGDEALGVNEYNGGLLAVAGHPWLRGRTVPDDRMAAALDLLYRVDGEQVDYRDLSVRHLGTIFEQLLAYRLVQGEEGSLTLATADGRHKTGAYFTPEHVVDEIVERTLAPIYDERSARVRADGRRGQEALDELLDIHVLDPAIGSGHFLVGAAAYLARRIANDPSYTLEWSLTELQGLVAERCLSGVDVNPMAVEIARLALWLSTVRDDRPLRSLVNLRTGNSLVGAELGTLLDGGTDLISDELAVRARGMLDRIASIASIDARTGEEAREKERLAEEIERVRAPLRTECDAAVAPPVGPGAGAPFHWAIEFPDRFVTGEGQLRPDGGFDAVIGNPPYVRIQELGRDVAAHCRERYATAYGSFDAYVPFIERGLRLLRPGGRLGFIVPSTFLKLDYGTRLRELLGRERLVEAIVDFGHAQVFDGATNYTCILVLDRSGREEVEYTVVRGVAPQVRHALATGGLPAAQRYPVAELTEAPWILVGADERDVLSAMRRTGIPLAEATAQIFQGLITSADAVYIVEDRGTRGERRVVVTRDGEEVELEPDLLRPLATGPDVERYALRPLRSLLLFPYVRGPAGMRLITEDELRALPRTWAYLREHESVLRGRERNRMDGDGWWQYVYPKSLDLHDRPKLGVAATVRRLEVAGDLAGTAYFHNVRVNGILPRQDGPPLEGLLALLNARAVDFAFRRGAAPLQNGYFTANKQFVSWLPVPDPLPGELASLGRRLNELAGDVERERAQAIDWLGSLVGADVRRIRGSRAVVNYAETGVEGALATLGAQREALTVDPRDRDVRARIGNELSASVDRIAELRTASRALEREADAIAYDAYGLTGRQRELVEREYRA
jgi:type I restriction-modification system DNA methylase subunit